MSQCGIPDPFKDYMWRESEHMDWTYGKIPYEPSKKPVSFVGEIRAPQYEFNMIRPLAAMYGNKHKMGMRRSTPMCPEIMQYYNKRLLNNAGPAMIFKRYADLPTPEMSIYDHLVTACINNLKPINHDDYIAKMIYKESTPMAVKFNPRVHDGRLDGILNDSWTVNLRPNKPKERETKMEAFENLQKYLRECGKPEDRPNGQNITAELEDLKKIYTDGLVATKRSQDYAHQSLVSCMRQYLKAFDDNNALASKLSGLECKMAKPKEDEECDCPACREDGDDS